jgi:hypothetical protein
MKGIYGENSLLQIPWQRWLLFNLLLQICDVVEILCKIEFTIVALEWSIHALTKMT